MLAVLLPMAAAAEVSDKTCVAAAQRAAAETGVPLAVLLAVGLTESGRGPASDPAPWPWTLNIAGRGHFLDSESEALDLARGTLAGGQKSFDVGCFQLNYRWHGDGFASLEEMMAPEANAAYAGRFLVQLFEETGDWSRAAGFYHSRTPEHTARYRRIFDKHYAGLTTRGVPDVPDLADLPSRPVQVAQAARINNFPLLQATDGVRTAGSLFPSAAPGNGGLFAGAARPLWSG